MGLHSRTRYVIYPQGTNRTEQMKDIIARAVYLFDRVLPVICPHEPVITHKFARNVSLTLTFVGFTDEEVLQLLTREVIRQKRIWRR